MWSLKDLDALDVWPEAALSPEARTQLQEARERVECQNEYYRQRARQPPKARLVSMTAEKREARRQKIEANRLKMAAELRGCRNINCTLSEARLKAKSLSMIIFGQAQPKFEHFIFRQRLREREARGVFKAMDEKLARWEQLSMI